MSNNTLKVQTKDENVYRQVRIFLNETSVTYYTYQLKSEKLFRVVIRDLHPRTEKSEITAALKELGHEAREVANVIIKKKKDASKDSEKISVPLPLFFVALEPQPNNKHIYEIKALLHQWITVEVPRKKKEIPQCKNCQQFGHIQKYYQKIAKCVKCGEKHKTQDCKKSRKTRTKCTNCAGNHTANWKGCEFYQSIQQKFAPKYVSAQDRIKEKLYVSSNGKSYAAVAQQPPQELNPENIPLPSGQGVSDNSSHIAAKCS